MSFLHYATRFFICSQIIAVMLLTNGPPRPRRPKRRRLRLQATDTDIATILQRLQAELSITDCAILEAQIRDVQGWREQLAEDGSWPDVDYQDQTSGSWTTPVHLRRIVAMAQVYIAPDHELTDDPALRMNIHRTLDFWLVNDFQNPNWWHNLIGVPRDIGSIMVLMQQELTEGQYQQGIEILRRSIIGDSSGANLTWLATNQLMRGCLEPDPDAIAEAFAAVFAEIKVAEVGEEGIQADYSFHQHQAVLYSGGYGLWFTYDGARIITYAHETRFAIEPERFMLLNTYVLDGQQWFIRGIMFDYSTIGRGITLADKDALPLISAIQQLAVLPGPRQTEMTDFAARLQGDPNVFPIAGNCDFWRSDTMSHHRSGYATSVRMHSTRTYNTDAYTNDEGRNTNHTADGATYFYRTGEEYRDIFPVWNWRRVPGITCEQRDEPLDLAGLNVLGTTSFVGGVSDGMYGAAAMDLQQGELMARKSWFYFDREVVCLGAGIHNPTEYPVVTAVNQCLLKGPVIIQEPRLQRVAVQSGDHTLEDGGSVHHDNIGYYFPAGTPVQTEWGPREGRWSDIGPGSSELLTIDVFDLWIDHGVMVENGTYFYIVLPDFESSDLASYDADTAIEVLQNTPTLQAVRQQEIGVCGAIFHEAGTLDGGAGWTITVDQPCLLLLREIEDGVQLTLANPENMPLLVVVEVDRALVGPGSTPIDATRTRIEVVLPEGIMAGQSAIIPFQYR